MRKISLLALALLTPWVAFAAPASFKDFTASLVEFVNSTLVPLFYALAFILFLIGMLRFFFLGGDEGREKGKTFMLWGIIGFVVLFSVWGIVRLLLTILPGSA